MDKPQKADLKSLDVADDKRRQLAQLFPEAVTEVRDEPRMDANGREVGGEYRYAVDFEKLKGLLGEFSEILENQRERYGMTWPGKNECLKIIQQPSIATLKPCREESINFDDTENVFIEGDNLEALKLLQKSYYGKAKLIYIDPPYNTGKQFIYPDRYEETLDTYLAYSGQVDAEGRKFAANPETEGRYHTRWINMMYPRLFLAKNLLAENGVIFISIDEHEVGNLRSVCDEIFGEENRVFEVCVVNNMKGRNDREGIATCHESLLIYRKPEYDPRGLTLSEEKLAEYDQQDENGERFQWRDLRKRGGADTRKQRPNLYFPLYADAATGEVSLAQTGRFSIEVVPSKSDGTEGCWRWGNKKVADNIGIIRARQIQTTGAWRASYRVYLQSNGSQKRSTPKSVWIGKQYSTDSATKALRQLIPEIDAKKYTPKPVGMLKEIIDQSTRDGDLVIDFFGGTGSTGHALLELDREQRLTRRFIVVQLPEPTPEDSAARAAGYATEADIGKARLSRVVESLDAEYQNSASELGIEDEGGTDLGFRVFKLGRSNFRLWDGSQPGEDPEKIAKQLELHEQHIDPNATQEDILFELLLKAGFPLTTKVEKVEMAGKEVFSIAEGALLICLQDEITKELIKAMADADPLQVICLDSGFKNNDQLKANAVQTFKARNKGAETATVFRTV